jgi:hypothetical protein
MKGYRYIPLEGHLQAGVVVPPDGKAFIAKHCRPLRRRPRRSGWWMSGHDARPGPHRKPALDDAGRHPVRAGHGGEVMNSAARELGRHAGAIAHQRSREPILAKARQMIPAGQPIPPALNPPLILSTSDQVHPRHAKEARHGKESETR